MMSEHFGEIVDVGFTARMEDGLDDIETKGIRWKKIVEDYYEILRDELKKADAKIPKLEPELELTGEKCPQCGSRMVLKRGAKDTYYHVCVNETCRHRVQVESDGGLDAEE